MKLRSWLILAAAAFLTCVSILGWHLRVQATPPLTLATAGLKLEQLTNGVYGLVSSTDFPPKNPATTAICNAGIVIGSDRVLVIDPFQNPQLGNLLLDTVKTLTDKPVEYVVNTHYHFDHTGGNPAIVAKQIPILGRGPIRDFMLARNKQMDPNPTPPAIIVNGATDLFLGDRKVALEAVEGHSGGTDLVAYVPDAKVLFTGDILFNQRIPYVADGNIQQWKESLDRLIKTYPEAKVLPGHGPVTNGKGLVQQKQYFEDLTRLAQSWQAKKLTKEKAIATAKVPTAYQNYLFQGLYKSNLETAYQQITAAQP